MTTLNEQDARELERLRAWKQEAMPLFDGLQDLGRALDLPLGVLVTGPRAVEAANQLRERLAKVEALAADWDGEVDWSAGRWDYGDNAAYERCARDLRAALASDPTHTQNGTQA